MRFAGEFAALGTAVCWAAGSNFFAAAGRRMGSLVLNRLRITVACVFLGVALTVTRGSPWPTWASGSQVGLLAASGLVDQKPHARALVAKPAPDELAGMFEVIPPERWSLPQEPGVALE